MKIRYAKCRDGFTLKNDKVKNVIHYKLAHVYVRNLRLILFREGKDR